MTPSPIGPLILVAVGPALTGLYFEGHRPGGPPPAEPGASPVLEAAKAALAAHFAGRRRAFERIPIQPAGTAFQQRVWAELLRVGYGELTSYGALAAAIGRPRAVRAVAGAVARNPISILIPCHRVVGADGRLTGFAGGLARKRWLLDLEAGTAAARL